MPDPNNPDLALKPGSRVKTTVGMVRHGTVLAIWPARDPRDPALLDVRWDDTRNEVCTGVRASNIEAGSAVDALAAVLDRPPAPPARSTTHFHDLVVHAGGDPPLAGRLGLGFALLAGDDDLGAWW
jgi:hypothetical protein